MTETRSALTLELFDALSLNALSLVQSMLYVRKQMQHATVCFCASMHT